MKLVAIFVILLVVGLVVPVSAQSTQRNPDYAAAVISAKECKQAVDKDLSLSEAEKLVLKKQCDRDATKKIVNEYESKTNREEELRIKNLIQCETWYDNYKVTTIEKFRPLKPQQLVNDCIVLYKDDIWQYSAKDRFQKILDRANELGLFEIAKAKAVLDAGGLPPLKQIEQGIPKTHVDCKEQFVLVYKISTKKPACISLDSVDRVLQRGWGSLELIQ